MADIIFRVHSDAASGLSSSSTFTELISVDGYEERQVTEANTSLSLAAVPQTCHQSAQRLAHTLFITHITSKTVITRDKTVYAENWDELLRLCVKIYSKQNALCLTFKLNKKRRLTSPAIGVGSLLTLLIVPGLILLISLQAKERERESERQGKEGGKWKLLVTG